MCQKIYQKIHIFICISSISFLIFNLLLSFPNCECQQLSNRQVQPVHPVDNIDTKYPIIFNPYMGSEQELRRKRQAEETSSSYFGISSGIIQHQSGFGVSGRGHVNVILIGAPKMNSNRYQNVYRSGSVFRCQLNANERSGNVSCQEVDLRRFNDAITNKMLFGASISTSLSKDNFFSCAHLWSNYQNYPLGKCYVFNSNGEPGRAFQPINPQNNRFSAAREGRQRPYLSHSMAGFSVAQGRDNQFILGVPGYADWIGSINKFSIGRSNSVTNMGMIGSTSEETNDNSYIGYATVIGRFISPNEDYVAVSAPRKDQYEGKVYLVPFDAEFRQIQLDDFKRFELKGEFDTVGEYFGYSLHAMDMNNDNLDDLIVSAPFYSEHKSNTITAQEGNHLTREMGRVYAFISRGSGSFESPQILYGSNSKGARFGTSIASLDVDLDGFEDLVVGAPYERSISNLLPVDASISDRHSGAVYIYRGGKNGFNETPFRVITAEEFSMNKFQGFGSSLSTHVDLDRNGYNDLLVGSFLSEQTVLLRTQPIVDLKITKVEFSPSRIKLAEKNCNSDSSREAFTCLQVRICLSATGKRVKSSVTTNVTLEILDSKLVLPENRAFVELNGSGRNSKRRRVSTTFEVRTIPEGVCFKEAFRITLNNDLMDTATSLEVRLIVSLPESSDSSRKPTFCPDCGVAFAQSRYTYITFENRCSKDKCVSDLTLKAEISPSNVIIEGDEKNKGISLDINVRNDGENALNTTLIIHVTPMLPLADSFDEKRCFPVAIAGYYACSISDNLQTRRFQILKLAFNVPKIDENSVRIAMELKSESEAKEGSEMKMKKEFELQVRRNAELRIVGGPSRDNVTITDKEEDFSAFFDLNKRGPSRVKNGEIEIMIPTRIDGADFISNLKFNSSLVSNCQFNPPSNSAGLNSLQFVEEKENVVEKEHQVKLQRSLVESKKNENGTTKIIYFSCDSHSQCSTYKCQLVPFEAKDQKVRLTFNAVIDVTKLNSIQHFPKYDHLILYMSGKLFSTDDGNGEKGWDERSRLSAETNVRILFNKQPPVAQERVASWIVIASGGFGAILLIIFIAILIKCGFFRRKTREETRELKHRSAMILMSKQNERNPLHEEEYEDEEGDEHEALDIDESQIRKREK